MSELSSATGFRIHDPQLLVATARRRENEMASIWRPGRILVLAFTGQLLGHSIAQVDHPDLKISVLLLVRDRATIGRPIRARAVAAHTRLERREQLNIGPVRIHNINLRRPRPPRNKRDLGSVRTV